MANRKQTPEQKISELAADIEREIAHWKWLNNEGGSDPFWQDGCNMNLTRNHVIHDKRQIFELCTANGLPLPDAYYLPTPPEVNDSYMANLKQVQRVKNLRERGEKITTEKTGFDENQMTLL